MQFNDADTISSLRANVLVPLTSITTVSTTIDIPIDNTIRSVIVAFHSGFSFASGESSFISIRGKTSNVLYLGRNDNVNTFTFSWLAIGEVVPELDPVITLEIVYNRVAPGPVVHPMEISVIGTSQAVAQQIYTNEASPLYVSAVGGHVLETSAFNFPPITAPAGAITNISTGGNGSLTRVFITNDGALQSTGNLNVDGSAVVVWTCQPHTTITLEMSNVPFNTLVSISNNAGGNPVYVSTLYGFLQT